MNTKCPECLESAAMTDWLPKRGLDQQLREFKCGLCGYVSYLRLTSRQLEKLREEEEEGC